MLGKLTVTYALVDYAFKISEHFQNHVLQSTHVYRRDFVQKM